MKIVLAGSGQTVSHWTPGDGTDRAPSPSSLRAEAARKALGDLRDVDAVAVVRTTEDSVPTSTYPFGRDANPPATLAHDLGLQPKHLIHSDVGGQTPGTLLLEMANRIADGEFGSVLISGAEATGASKLASKAGMALDWSRDTEGETDERGPTLDWVDPLELRHGLITPSHYYGLAESALAHLHTDALADYRAAMGRLLAPFSEVASANPHSMFREARSADWLATPSPSNYPVAYPYLKWHIAQDAVNQGAAVLLMSESAAREAGRTDLAYLHAGASAANVMFTEREDIAYNSAADSVYELLTDTVDLEVSSIDLWDIYSCFPVAVWTALVAFGMETPGLPGVAEEAADMGGYESDPAPAQLTVTGGLPFFGGPGNNYSLHALAEMHTRLSGTAKSGFVLANGGWMSKVAGSLLSGAPVDYVPAPPMQKVTDTRPRVTEDCHGDLEAFTYTNTRSGPGRGAALVRVRHTDRALATVTGEDLERLVRDPSPIGSAVDVVVRNGIGQLSFRA